MIKMNVRSRFAVTKSSAVSNAYARTLWTSNKIPNQIYNTAFQSNALRRLHLSNKRSPFHLSEFHAAELEQFADGWHSSDQGKCSCKCYCLPVLFRIIKQWWGKFCHLPSFSISLGRDSYFKLIRSWIVNDSCIPTALRVCVCIQNISNEKKKHIALSILFPFRHILIV